MEATLLLGGRSWYLNRIIRNSRNIREDFHNIQGIQGLQAQKYNVWVDNSDTWANF